MFRFFCLRTLKRTHSSEKYQDGKTTDSTEKQANGEERGLTNANILPPFFGLGSQQAPQSSYNFHFSEYHCLFLVGMNPRACQVAGTARPQVGHRWGSLWSLVPPWFSVGEGACIGLELEKHVCFLYFLWPRTMTHKTSLSHPCPFP